MDGQRFCALALLLLTSVAGCDKSRLLPLWPGNRTPDPHADRAPVGLPPQAPTQGAGKPTKLMPETLVAMGQFREQQAVDMDLTPQGREYLMDQARKAYMRALETDPCDPTALLALARLYEKTGNHERAIESYAHLLKNNDSDAPLRYEIGMMHARHKEWDQSLAMLRQAAQLDPENRAFVRSYGLALARAGQVEESMTQLRKVLSDAEAHCMMARMMHHVNQADACQRHLALALQINPELSAARELEAQLNGVASPADIATVGHEETIEEPAIASPDREPQTLPQELLEAEPLEFEQE